MLFSLDILFSIFEEISLDKYSYILISIASIIFGIGSKFLVFIYSDFLSGIYVDILSGEVQRSLL